MTDDGSTLVELARRFARHMLLQIGQRFDAVEQRQAAARAEVERLRRRVDELAARLARNEPAERRVEVA